MNFSATHIRFQKTTVFFLLIPFGFFPVQSQDYSYRTFKDLTEALQSAIEYSVEDVRILDLSEQNLTVLPKEIGRLKDLQYLNLSYNRLTLLPKEIGQLLNLQELGLQGNSFSPEERERIRKLLPNCEIDFE
ncbi:hypothetical protein [Leptospira alstonii]|uniref:hypothetical protein n=1 Tax=Leptospira alstonii TaxID=28452 RepID=UPI0007732C92|nr:hypothetical protein [Leptospira alstonii]